MHKLCPHCSVESSVPTSRVRVPSTPSTLLSFLVFVLYLSCEKNENNQKEGGLAHFLTMNHMLADDKVLN